MSDDTEEWREVPGFEGFYAVSSRGRVRRVKSGWVKTGGIRCLSIDDRGYPALALSRNGKKTTRRVHELVAEAFAGPRPSGQVARHLNDIKTDNRWPENVAWGTPGENADDAVRNGRNRNVGKEACPAGHLYVGRNLIIAKRSNGRTFRQCRTCLYKRQGRRAPVLSAVGDSLAEPYWSDGAISLYYGDCLDILLSLPGESVDIVATSPPYNMGLVPGGNGRGMYRPGASNKAGRFREGYRGSNDDAMPYGEYCKWQRAVLAECWRVARLGVFYNHRPRVEHGKLRDPLDGDYGLPLRQRIILDRGTGIDVNLRNFCTRGEYLLLFAKPEFQLMSHSASGMGDIWHLGIETNVPDHPAPFPVELPARCNEATGARSVLDPFAGSGTTLIAARNAGIQGIGIENWEPYCELAVRRYTGERRGRNGAVQMTLDAS